MPYTCMQAVVQNRRWAKVSSLALTVLQFECLTVLTY